MQSCSGAIGLILIPKCLYKQASFSILLHVLRSEIFGHGNDCISKATLLARSTCVSFDSQLRASTFLWAPGSELDHRDHRSGILLGYGSGSGTFVQCSISEKQ